MKTNKLILACIFMLCTLPAAAQVKLGIEVGSNLSGYITGGSHSLPAGNKDMKVGFQAGLTADYEFRNRLMLMSGLYFVRKGGSLKLGEHIGQKTFYHYPDVEVKMDYLQVPVKLGYNFRMNDKISLIPYVGVYAAYGLPFGHSDIEVADHGKVTSDTWKPLDGYNHGSGQGIAGFRRWEIGGLAGVKVVIGRHYAVSFDYNIGLNKAQRAYGLRNSTFQLSVGYRF